MLGLPAYATQVLDVSAQRTLSIVAEAMVPGAARAGVVAFVTAMLASARPNLFYGYLNFPLPPAEFYRAGLGALAAYARARTSRSLESLPTPALQKLLPALLAPEVPDWNGPPAVLVYLAIRNDAIDVVYSSEAAYDALNLPYMAHIAPPRPW
jgi:hypothetical protein